MSASSKQPVFYYDLGDPACYLAAERIITALAVLAEWEPVLASAIGIEPASIDRAAVERQAAASDMQPVRWPPQLPMDTDVAMLAATYAKRIGKTVAFSLAAFRQAFAAGRDLGELDTVLVAGAACEIHPSALSTGIRLRHVGDALAAACERANRAGIRALPALQVGDALFQGEGMLELAAAELGARVR